MKKQLWLISALLVVLLLVGACEKKPTPIDVEVPPATGFGAHQRLQAFIAKPFVNDSVAWGDTYDAVLAQKNLEVYDNVTLIDERSAEGQMYDAYRDIYFFELGGMLNRCNTLFQYTDQMEYFYELQRIKQVLTNTIGEPNEGTLETFDYLPPENSDVLYCMWLAEDGSKLEILLSDNTTRGNEAPFFIMIRMEASTTA